MCGRYMLRGTADQIRGEVDAFFLPDEEFDFAPRYNIAPSQLAPIVYAEEGGLHLEPARWGLVPGWAFKKRGSDDAKKFRDGFINARAETAAEKPSFRDAFRKRRCLVPASGFYEWQRRGSGGKQPYLFHLSDVAPTRVSESDIFFMAGLFEPWHAEDELAVQRSFTILTTEANAVLRPVHERMPVILAPEQLLAWLDPRGESSAELVPCPDEWLAGYPVSTQVNSPRLDEASLIDPLPEPMS